QPPGAVPLAEAVEGPAPEVEVGGRGGVAGGEDREAAQRRLGPQSEGIARLVVRFVDDSGAGRPAEHLLDPRRAGARWADHEDPLRGRQLVGGCRAVGGPDGVQLSLPESGLVVSLRETRCSPLLEGSDAILRWSRLFTNWTLAVLSGSRAVSQRSSGGQVCK